MEQVDSGARCQLTVSRPARGPRDRLRRYRIIVDGSPIGTVRAGASVTVSLSPGRHEVQARIDWLASRVRTVELTEETDAFLYVGPSGASVNLQRSADHETYLELVDQPEDLPRASLQVAGVPQPKGPRWVRAILALLLVAFVVPRHVSALRSGDVLTVAASVCLVAFWVWIAWSTFRRSNRSRVTYWQHQAWWWTGWLAIAVVLATIGLSQHRLHAIAALYIAVPLIGTVSSWASVRLVAQEVEPQTP